MRELMELVKGAWKIRLYRSGRFLNELKMKKTTSAPRSVPPPAAFPDSKSAFAAMQARADALLAEGWTDTGVGAPRRAPRVTPKAPEADEAALESQFAALVARTIAALQRSRSEAGDAKAWREAIRRYGDLKAKAGGNRDENLVHFFAVDGVALAKPHPVVLQRVRATQERKARWLRHLQQGGA
ncbi:MAG: hypothetical protein AB1938_19885 [Myxococcota bacterium]